MTSECPARYFVGDEDDALARVDEVHERGHGAEAGRERDPVLGRLERREAALERRARGVVDARVVVALVLADGVLHVRRGLVDRRDDRAGGGVRLLALVDRARLEIHHDDANHRVRSRSGLVTETGLPSHQTPFTFSSRALRSYTGSLRQTSRSPRRMD